MNIKKLNYLIPLLITIIKSQNCTKENCPSTSGECIEEICLCAPGYTTYYSYETKEIKTYCNYSYKYKEWAIWLEMCLPFGVGHFYAGRYIHSFFKFSLFWFLSSIKVLFKKKVRGYPDLNKTSKILLWVFGILYAVDYFGFTFDFYLDGNKLRLI
jgi:hypothetical protein